jgi:hypothetical protein
MRAGHSVWSRRLLRQHKVLLFSYMQDGNAQDAADTEELTAAREALATVQGLLQ